MNGVVARGHIFARMHVRKWLTTLIGVLISLYAFTATAGPQIAIQFPGKISQIASPNGRHILVNVDSESKEHTLSISGNKEGTPGADVVQIRALLERRQFVQLTALLR